MFIMVLFGLFFIFSYSLGNVAAATNNTIYVNGSSGNDSWDGQLAIWNGTSGPKATIKNATGTVSTGGTVYIADGTYEQNNIPINSNMTIIGQSQQNTIIYNGLNQLQSLFIIGSGINVTFINLTLRNGIFSGYSINNIWFGGEGGAINNHGHLTVNNCSFNNNQATNIGYGGAIYNTGNLTVNGSSFLNNTAAGYSGSGGGAIFNMGNLDLDDSTFLNNIATCVVAGGYGGTIFNGGTLVMNNCIFTNNTAINGGTIYNNGTLTENNNTFANNTGNYGSAVYNDVNGNITDINNLFNNNTALVNGQGGAIYNGGILINTNGTFTNNTAISGGAIYNIGILSETSSKFINNNASYGGALTNNLGTLSINFCDFNGNTAYEGCVIDNINGTVNASSDWWGSNIGPSTLDVCGTTVNSWLILTLTSNSTSILNYGNSTITADLLHDNLGNLENNSVPDGIPVNFTSTLGTINNSSIMVNGIAQSTLNGGAIAGVSNVSVTVDQQTLQIPIKVLDNIPLTININNPSSAYVRGIVFVNVIATDNINVTCVVFNISSGDNYTDNNGSDGWNYNWDTTNLADGTYNITATAYDTANNSESQTITVNVDNTLPTVVTSLPSGIYNINESVVLNASDNMDLNPIIYYNINNSTIWNTQANTVKINLPEGKTVISYYVKDAAGNQCPTQSDTYTIDTLNPIMIAVNPIKNSVNIPPNQAITVKFSKPIKDGSMWIDLYDSTGMCIPVTASINGNVLTLNHSKLLANGQCSLTLHTGSFTDLNGDYLAICSDSFYVNNHISPKIKTTTPANNAINIPVTQIIQVGFTEGIKFNRTSSIILKNSNKIAIPYTSYITGNTLVITPNFPLAYGTTYTLTFHTNCITDLAGNGFKVCSTKFVTIPTKSYSNYGISFKYPYQWGVSVSTQDGQKLIFVNKLNDYNQDQPQAIVSVSTNPTGMSDAQSIQEIKSATYPSGFKILSKSTYTLNGNSAYGLIFTINNKEIYPEIMEDQEVNIAKNGKTYTIDCISTVTDFNSEKPIFNMILNSIKI
ncbi:MAG: Ig-like domain-containing protein [Methanobacterium sp.]